MTGFQNSQRAALPLIVLTAICIYGCGDSEQATETDAAFQPAPTGDASMSQMDSLEAFPEAASAQDEESTVVFSDGGVESGGFGSGVGGAAGYGAQPSEADGDVPSPGAPVADSSIVKKTSETEAMNGSNTFRNAQPALRSALREEAKSMPESRNGQALSGGEPAAPAAASTLELSRPSAARPQESADESRPVAGRASSNSVGEGRTSGVAESAEEPASTPARSIRESLLADLSKRTMKMRQLDLLPGEELWVIARDQQVQPAADDDGTPGCGALMATLPGAKKLVPVPLKHTDVKAGIDGYVATVKVKQQFHNPYDSKIEASYVFPLPQDAAVNEFVMTVGERRIRGIIREREQAEKVYAAARAQGHVAALMTQQRPNIFTQKVANIEPGKQIDIDIRYFNTLPYNDGQYEFVFPMVVGPRFNPPATSDGVGAVPRGSTGSSGQSTDVSYLAPDERSGHDISLSVEINTPIALETVHSVNHAVDVDKADSGRQIVRLGDSDTIPNRDFVLRFQVAGDQVRTALMTHEDDHGRYFTMMIYPPADLHSVSRSPMEMVFVLDCSGSMKGKPLAQAKAAISHALQSLNERDTFQIIQFSNNASQLGSSPLPATPENVKQGLQYLTSLNSTGGTHMIEGIKAALDFPHDEGRFRLVSFMTDGFIGNEQQILQTLHEKLGASRVFSFGVGSSPNRFLMDRMSIIGRGAVAYLSLNDDAVAVMDDFNRRISHPAMTDLSIDWGSMQVADVYPQRIPDLIVGRPIVITGRYRGEVSDVTVSGRVDLQPTSFVVEQSSATVAQHAGIAAVWARLKIKDMMNIATYEPAAAEEIRSTVLQTALNHNLMSAFTAFVAVDSLSKTAGNFGTTVAVPVPVPDGVRYDTTVSEPN